MKIHSKLKNKRINEIQQIYNQALDDLTPYSEQIYKIIKNEKDKTKAEEQIIDIILNSLSHTMSLTLDNIKHIFPNSYNEKTKIDLENMLYNKDGLTLEQRVHKWFDTVEEKEQLFYHISLILETETNQIIPQISKSKLNKKTIYYAVEPGGGDCSTGICLEYADGEAYPEDDIELPPYHPDCQCQAFPYELDELTGEEDI